VKTPSLLFLLPLLPPVGAWPGVITLGKPDQFNRKRRGECIVFVTGDDQVDAASAAHEIGHTLGLQHVDPNTVIDPLHDEFMQAVGDFATLHLCWFDQHGWILSFKAIVVSVSLGVNPWLKFFAPLRLGVKKN
jgi:hypothetical protein